MNFVRAKYFANDCRKSLSLTPGKRFASKDSPEIKQALEPVQEFSELMKKRRADELKSWLAKAEKSRISEPVGFVNGIKPDFAAVEAAFSGKWSNGQTEGQVNRLKFIKRQMHGRAKFDLLKARVVHQN